MTLRICAYPENLSRIILTLTCSPIWNQRLRTKFSSIHGSSSPILYFVSNSSVLKYKLCLPQRGLLITALRPRSTIALSAWGVLRGRLRLLAWLPSHCAAVLWWWCLHLRRGNLLRTWALELFIALERHCDCSEKILRFARNLVRLTYVV